MPFKLDFQVETQTQRQWVLTVELKGSKFHVECMVLTLGLLV